MHPQFLPQDKVVEFARLTPVQLLASTQQAIGGGQLARSHARLTELRGAQEDHGRVSALAGWGVRWRVLVGAPCAAHEVHGRVSTVCSLG
jgi:hypothetical protein